MKCFVATVFLTLLSSAAGSGSIGLRADVKDEMRALAESKCFAQCAEIMIGGHNKQDCVDDCMDDNCDSSTDDDVCKRMCGDCCSNDERNCSQSSFDELDSGDFENDDDDDDKDNDDDDSGDDDDDDDEKKKSKSKTKETEDSKSTDNKARCRQKCEKNESGDEEENCKFECDTQATKGTAKSATAKGTAKSATAKTTAKSATVKTTAKSGQKGVETAARFVDKTGVKKLARNKTTAKSGHKGIETAASFVKTVTKLARTGHGVRGTSAKVNERRKMSHETCFADCMTASMA